MNKLWLQKVPDIRTVFTFGEEGSGKGGEDT